MTPEEEEDLVLAEARLAWSTGDPHRAARVLEDYLARHPGRRQALLERARPPPPEPPASREGEPAAKVACLRCGQDVLRSGQARLHDSGYLADHFFGDLFVGRMEMDVYACRRCGHVEFMAPDAHLLGGFDSVRKPAPFGVRPP